MIVQDRKPRDGHREDFRKFLEPMFDPAFPVVHPFAEQEGPPHAACHTVILVFRQSSIDRFLKLEVLGIQEIPASTACQLKMDGTLAGHGRINQMGTRNRHGRVFWDVRHEATDVPVMTGLTTRT